MLFYIMSPYTGTRTEMFCRHHQTMQYAAALAEEGIPVISPIMHWHTAAHECDLPKDAEFWMAYNRRLFSSTDAGILFMQPGWRESKGVGAELQWHQDEKKPVYMLDLERTDIDGYVEKAMRILLRGLRADYPLLREVPISPKG